MTEEAAGAPQGHRLDSSLARGLAWTATGRWAAQLVGWGTTIITARFLNPTDYGIVGLATVYLAFVQLFSEFGLGSAVVNLPNLSKSHAAQLNSLSLGLGGVAYLITLALSYPLSLIFRTPELTTVMLSLGILSVFNGLQTVPIGVLQREMAFRWLSGIEAIQALVQGLLTAVLAVSGFRYWSLVLGALLGQALGTVLFRRARPIPFARPMRSELGSALNFGRDVFLGRVGWFAYTNADQLIVGRRLGPGALGAYGMALALSSVPIDKVAGLLTRVLPSYLAAVRDDDAAARRYLLLALEGLSLITIPLAIGLAVVADDFVYVVLGAKWAPAIFPLQAMCVVGALRAVMVPFAPLLTSRGKIGLVRTNGLIAAGLLIAGFYLGTYFGLRGVAIAWLVAYPFTAVPLVVAVLRSISLPLRDLGRALAPAAFGSAGMIVTVLLCQHWLAGSTSRVESLSLQVAVGAATYLGLTHRVLVTRGLAFVRSARSTESPVAAK